MYQLKLKDSHLDLTNIKEISYEKGSRIERFKEGSIIPIINDEMFKTLFSREENIKFPCKLLSYLIDVPYEELLTNLHFTKNETGKIKKNDTNYRQDLVVEINRTLVNVKMNNNPDETIRERNLSYLFRLREDKKEKNQYQTVLQINLNNYCYKEDNTIRRDYAIVGEDGSLLTNKIVIIDIYLPNIKRKCYNKKEELTEMERFLLIGIEENQKKALEYVGEDIVMKEFQENIKRSSEEWKLIEAYDKEWAMKDLGRQETTVEIAKKMMQDKVPLEKIIMYTGLTEKELLSLKEELS